jgi:flavin-dependent dehydrogenase
MAVTPEYDALIVGARVAGSSLAIRLARQGRSVVVVDRDSFPSDTISTHFLAFYAVESLRRLGVLDRILSAGFRPVLRHRAWIDDIVIEVPAGPPGAFSIAPKRIVLDKILIDRARECGADVIERARADGLIVENGQVVGAKVQMIGGDAREIRARIVIGADGKTSQVARWVDAPRYNERAPGRPIYLGYFQGVTDLPQTTIEMFFKSERIGFCFPMRPDEHLLCVEAQPADFQAIRRDPMGWFMAIIATLPGMRERTRRAELEGRLLGVRSVENCFRKPYGPGWALTGDATYLKDPCTGLGVGDALLQGFLLARALGTHLDGAPWEETMVAYQERRDTLLTPLYEQTVAATEAVDSTQGDLDRLRVMLLSQHDARKLVRALPGLAEQIFDPMDQLRHAAVAEMYAEASAEKTPA